MINENIKRLLDRAWGAYDLGKPFMSDAEFDNLSDKCEYTSYGSEFIGEKATHPYQMQSLKKVFDDEPDPYSLTNAISSPKLDGTAICLVYEEGFLTMALRRGRSGDTEGQVVTDKVAFLVPNKIMFTAKHQINGEVVCDKTIENARNFASGAFGIKDIEEFKRDKLPALTFIAYSVTPKLSDTYISDMALLSGEKLCTVLDEGLTNLFRTDGTVFRENSNAKYEKAGSTSKHPRGAFARKRSSDVASEITTLRAVKWQVGRTGQVTPVANFDEIIIDDAKITKATLHNAGFIEEMQLDIDDRIIITRSGGVIPKVLGKV